MRTIARKQSIRPQVADGPTKSLPNGIIRGAFPDTHCEEVIQDDYAANAQHAVNGSVVPMQWQGYDSYTLWSSSGLMVQFRSETSRLEFYHDRACQKGPWPSRSRHYVSGFNEITLEYLSGSLEKSAGVE